MVPTGGTPKVLGLACAAEQILSVEDQPKSCYSSGFFCVGRFLVSFQTLFTQLI
jgi:hypothetical protein